MPASKKPIYTAFIANLAIAATKMVAAGFTGSSAMASEGIHSLVDTSNEVLLLLGLKRSQKPPDDRRPFGYGKELYFWAFVVSLLFFALGGGVSIYEGIHHLQEPEPIKDPAWNYTVLGIALVFDGISFITAFREFNRQRGTTPFWQAVRISKDPSTFVVLFEDAADVIGIGIAFSGILLSQLLHNPYIDAIASILIGLLLTLVAVLLVRESRSLLMGETVARDEIIKVRALLENHPAVSAVSSEQSMYLGPEEVILILRVVFEPETVVMPYSSRSYMHIANSVNAVSTDDSWQRSGESSDTYLQGKMAGLNVVRRSGTPGIGGNLFLNGFTSLYATNQPLILVDGMLYDNASYGSSLFSGHVGNPLANIDIKDVDSYTLIKDGASMYGTRGANGVLLITTNHAKTQATTIDFAAYGAYNSKVSNLPVMKANDFRVYLSDLLKTVPGETDASIQMKPYMNDNPNPDYYRYHNQTDWQNEVMDNSYSQNYYLKVTGGDDIATYGLSVGYLKQAGILSKTNLQRYQTRFNADLNLSKKLTSNVSLSFVNNQQNLENQGLAPKTSLLYLGLVKSPFMAPHDINAAGEQSPNFAGYDSLNISNPSAIIDKMKGINNNYRFLGSINFKYQLTPKITLQTLLGANFDKVRETSFIPGLGVVPDTLALAITTNESATNTQRLYSLYNDTRASFNTRIGTNQVFSANLGFRYNTTNREIDYGHGYNSATDDYVSVSGGLPTLRTVGGENGKWNWLNLYANANYELNDRYFLTFNLASDGSSRFGRTADAPLTINGNKMSLMPSLAAGWLVSSEDFMSGVNFIEALKLRASYGIVGNDDIGNYSATQYYVSQNLLGSQGLVRGNIANTALKWETVKKVNAGFDASFFKERLNVSFDYFNNNSTDMITYEPVASITGFQYALTNNSAMKTHGVSLGVSGRIINSKLTWDLGVNLSSYKNMITKIPNNVLLTDYAGGTIITQVGQPANQFYGFKTNGVYTSDAEAAASGLQNRREDGTVTAFRGGDVRFVDSNHDGFIDNSDRQVIGNPNPNFTGGISTMLAYKRWSMDALLTFSSGNDIYNYTRRILVSQSGYENQLQVVNNRWRAQGQVTDVPRAEYGDPAGNSRFSDRWIEDGSYLRLRTISVTYNLPISGKGIKSARIYVTGNNVFTITNYLGYDPEFSTNGNVFSQGTDIGLEPQFRTIQLGIRLGL